jgi:adenylylsulfate kinase
MTDCSQSPASYPDPGAIPAGVRLPTRAEKEKLLGQRGLIVWIYGLSGSGKSTLAGRLTARLHEERCLTMQLDGDRLRAGLCCGLGYTDEGRTENLRRAAEVARLAMDCGLVVICSFITPRNEMRRMIRDIVGQERLLEVLLQCPYEVCSARDTKGLYAQAENNQLPHFTGRDSLFELPETSPDLVLPTAASSIEECSERLWQQVQSRISQPRPVLQ